uniref:Uncharacterized protein n=2 Tax=Kalmanozyma brasiliensis (strain GHG001) TaxID=1365824 RepID=V5EWL9_KALBG
MSGHFSLSSSQARRSRAARFGTSRHATYASPSLSEVASSEQPQRTAEEEEEDDQLALSYASPTGTSTSSIYLPEYVAWAISQLIAAANDPKLLRADHLKLAHLTDPQEHMAEAAHIPPKRSSLLHLATVSPQRYAAILAVLSEVRQRLSTRSPVEGSAEEMEQALPRWTPKTVLDFDCAAGEGLWAAAQVFREEEPTSGSSTSVQQYHGFDRRPNLLKSGKKVAQSSASNASPADPPKAEREVKLKDEGEEIEVDGRTYYEQESAEAVKPAETEDADSEEATEDQPTLDYFTGPKSAMASVSKTFQSVPLSKDLVSIGSSSRSLALSAFALSLMTSDANRFEAVSAMWASGASVIVIIDAASPRGFASIASARAQLLQLGKQDSEGAHVVAPCSHDKPCPLLHPFAISSSVAEAVGARADTGNPAKSSDICGFTARFHTPTFLRRTKHSDRGEENAGYSYVVVKRGERPSLVGEAQRRLDGGEDAKEVEGMVKQLKAEAGKTKTGILDLLRAAKQASAERRTLQEVDANAALTAGADAAAGTVEEGSDDQAMEELLKLLPDALKAEFAANSNDPSSPPQLAPEQLDAIMASIRTTMPTTTTTTSSSFSSPPALAPNEDGTITLPAPSAESELAMRLESYSWPRLIKSPLKKGGHVTLDACCATGNIERFTISKASGKQAYQDARKAKWGDLFPHPSRSRSVVKALNPITALEYSGVEGEGDLMERLVLRAPSKLNSGAQQKGKKGFEITGLDEDEDADSILAELFDDLPPTGDKKVDRGEASYRLISPNLVTPTKKQVKRLNINYANKWDHGGNKTSAKLTKTRTNVVTRQSPRFGEDEGDGFQSSLQSKQPGGGKVRRSSRKKSRGDWDGELFGN